MTSVSKSRFKERVLDLFLQVERTGKPIVITDRGKPVLRLVPYHEVPTSAVRELRKTVVKYRSPTKPVAAGDWKNSR